MLQEFNEGDYKRIVRALMSRQPTLVEELFRRAIVFFIQIGVYFPEGSRRERLFEATSERLGALRCKYYDHMMIPIRDEHEQEMSMCVYCGQFLEEINDGTV